MPEPDLHPWCAERMGINPESTADRSVLEMAGVSPIHATHPLRLARHVVVDSLMLETIDSEGAEQFDEVWGYDVLHHVPDPERVMAVARRRCKPDGRIRWFEWIDDTIHPDWLSTRFDGFGIMGIREGDRLFPTGRRRYMAIVADKVLPLTLMSVGAAL